MIYFKTLELRRNQLMRLIKEHILNLLSEIEEKKFVMIPGRGKHYHLIFVILTVGLIPY